MPQYLRLQLEQELLNYNLLYIYCCVYKSLKGGFTFPPYLFNATALSWGNFWTVKMMNLASDYCLSQCYKLLCKDIRCKTNYTGIILFTCCSISVLEKNNNKILFIRLSELACFQIHSTNSLCTPLTDGIFLSKLHLSVRFSWFC